MPSRQLAGLLALAAVLGAPSAPALAADPPAFVELHGTARDFRGSDLTASAPLPAGHVDFENASAAELGIVAANLGADGLPVYAKEGVSSPTTHGRTAFDQWFRDTANVNLASPLTLRLDRRPSGDYRFDDQSFFPLDGAGWVLAGREPTRPDTGGQQHNFSFTTELHSELTYTGTELLEVRGDDDIFVFLNGRLALDLGGVHGPQTATVVLSQKAGQLGLSVGDIVDLDIFQAERRTSGSSFQLTLPRLGFAPGTAAVATDGTPAAGESASCTAAGWPSGVTLSYAWLRDGAEIAGAQSAARTIDAADAGHELSCRITGSRRTSASATADGVQVERIVVDPPVREPEPRQPQPRQPEPSVEPPLPPAPPIVSVTEQPSALTRTRDVRVVFTHDITAAGYECRLDDGPWQRCSSPYTARGLRAGDHRVEIRAVMADGRRGPVAARAFQVNPYPPRVTIGAAALRLDGGATTLAIGCSPREGEDAAAAAAP